MLMIPETVWGHAGNVRQAQCNDRPEICIVVWMFGGAGPESVRTPPCVSESAGFERGWGSAFKQV